jgi:hypothetical protein
LNLTFKVNISSNHFFFLVGYRHQGGGGCSGIGLGGEAGDVGPVEDD